MLYISMMSYHGYLPVVKNYLAKLSSPTVLEVGVDRGVSFLTLATFMARRHTQFFIAGIDILVQEAVKLQLHYLDLQPSQDACLFEGNSLETLPKMAGKLKFDVVLLDGDHNYHTVSQELKLLESLTTPNSIIVVDDYDGRWATRDLFYAERAGYEAVTLATPKVKTEKHGVQPAVDDWLAANPAWKKIKLMPGEPVVLLHETNKTFQETQDG